eukprot:CAMPEP_0201941292 /NCGR_PEP_ID=MMETSP0903-20130614/46864_1 /ASSEMBLY_ACC=CAM_ASM_000552 /TAXON_ID=420261 /ORGANISM="Thalassiosira antarctica, Strain CCMP982" /LENGTH=67 /DNA_ID=CAMNT_0048483325 /DNA_START=182 /DNA_END=385 /DNA_ORIENTATION=+
MQLDKRPDLRNSTTDTGKLDIGFFASRKKRFVCPSCGLPLFEVSPECPGIVVAASFKVPDGSLTEAG